MDTDMDMDTNNEVDLDLDDKWIQEFKKIDKDYEIFYSDDINFIKISFVYIDKDNNIIKYKTDKYLLKQPNFLFRDEILEILKKNIVLDGLKYTLFSILKYNINLDPLYVKSFVTKKDINMFTEPFFSIIRNIDNIHFDKTICMFQDLNELFFVFHENCEKQTTSHRVTKRVYLKNAVTNHKKTVRK